MVTLYAPIIIFVYNRPGHIRYLIDSLKNNPEAKNSRLFVFSDGAKTESDQKKVFEVRKYVESLEQLNLFESVNVTKSENNKGLADSIIYGVSKVISEYGRAIIIEDDNIVSPDFLDYMNRGLEFYKNSKKIWAISGFSRQMTYPKDYCHDIYFMQRISSYAWATWDNRWNLVKWNIEKYYPSFLYDKKARRRFDEYGEDRSLMLDAQVCGKVNSWAIRFEYAMVQNDMYSVFPCISRTRCTGNDGSGTHSRKEVHTFDTQISDGVSPIAFERFFQDDRIKTEFVKAYKQNWKRKILGNIDYKLLYYRRKNG